MYIGDQHGQPLCLAGTGWFSFTWGSFVSSYTKPHLTFADQLRRLDWTTRLRKLLSAEIPACGRGLHELGFPAGWATERPWVDGGRV
jgi:hypothetical protein